MSLNHHILAKAATDAVLDKFKKAEWHFGNGLGQGFYRVGTSADFPSPDATFYDTESKALASFEFKPHTETKRGILTGVGQSIAYLQDSDISYLIAPRMLGDYRIGSYLVDLYASQIYKKIPTGLILYYNDYPAKVTLEHNIELLEVESVKKRKNQKIHRFWAKHQDLPLPLFHLILHYYYLGSTNMIVGDPYAVCWRERMVPPSVLNDLKTVAIYDLSGAVITTPAGSKPLVFLEKIIPKLSGGFNEKQSALKQKIDDKYSGDNYYNSIRKNFLSFIKSMQMIDSENHLTEVGFKLYHLGVVNGAKSKVFTDYFTKELLTTGHHLDLLLDLDIYKQHNINKSIDSILNLMEHEYESKGYIERNPNRRQAVVSKVSFLKYERILWKALNLIDADYTIQWRRITEICSLPDL